MGHSSGPRMRRKRNVVRCTTGPSFLDATYCKARVNHRVVPGGGDRDRGDRRWPP